MVELVCVCVWCGRGDSGNKPNINMVVVTEYAWVVVLLAFVVFFSAVWLDYF